MVQDGSLSFEVKNVLLKQKEVESVSIDQQHWDADGDGTATFPGKLGQVNGVSCCNITLST